jgi:hypothetical protein
MYTAVTDPSAPITALGSIVAMPGDFAVESCTAGPKLLFGGGDALHAGGFGARGKAGLAQTFHPGSQRKPSRQSASAPHGFRHGSPPFPDSVHAPSHAWTLQNVKQ